MQNGDEDKDAKTFHTIQGMNYKNGSYGKDYSVIKKKKRGMCDPYFQKTLHSLCKQTSTKVVLC